MFIADNWLAACLTIQILPYFWLYFVMGLKKKKKKQAMNISPTCIPSCTYSSETMVSKKQNEHYCLWNIFVPSNILNTNLFNTGILLWVLHFSCASFRYTPGCLHFWLKQAMTTNIQSVGKEGLFRRIWIGVPPAVFFQELLCHKHVYQMTFK